jgi:chromosome partitioning protein
MPHIIVFGNEKGGTGKSTIGMHVIVYLLRMGMKVASIDLDARQGTLTRYIENRKSRTTGLLIPQHTAVFKSQKNNSFEAQKEERDNFLEALERFKNFDVIVVDTPGSDGFLCRLAHSFANTLMTPLNDSFIDLDLLVHISPDFSIIAPSTYAEMVWEQRKERALRKESAIDWIVIRNRIGAVLSKNREAMEKILQSLAKRIGFKCGIGFGERVIFRELFLTGMTVLDIKESNMHFSHSAAKHELIKLVSMVDFKKEQKYKVSH